uniref:Uncharacterized protein n=1 Tax=Rhizophora mucronata TaxID=61149 RepID=A0A2P2NYZ1_RHIMU
MWSDDISVQLSCAIIVITLELCVPTIVTLLSWTLLYGYILNFSYVKKQQYKQNCSMTAIIEQLKLRCTKHGMMLSSAAVKADSIILETQIIIANLVPCRLCFLDAEFLNCELSKDL